MLGKLQFKCKARFYSNVLQVAVRLMLGKLLFKYRINYRSNVNPFSEADSERTTLHQRCKLNCVMMVPQISAADSYAPKFEYNSLLGNFHILSKKKEGGGTKDITHTHTHTEGKGSTQSNGRTIEWENNRMGEQSKHTKRIKRKSAEKEQNKQKSHT